MTRKFNNTNNLIEYSDIEVFEMVRSGTLHTFPRDFWNGIDALNIAKEITKHLFEKILKWSIEDIKSNPLSGIFHDNRLGSMLKNLFNNSIYEALLNAYPELEDWVNKESEQHKYSGNTNEKFTDEELIEKLQQKANELGRNPLGREINNPDVHTYINRFGSWEKSLIVAGLLEDIYAGIEISKKAEQDIKQTLKEFVLENDKLPNEDEILSLISEGELKTYFKSLTGVYDFLEKEYSKEDLVNILKYKNKKLGRLPTGRDMKVPRAIIYIDVFGSWDNALKESNLA